MFHHFPPVELKNSISQGTSEPVPTKTQSFYLCYNRYEDMNQISDIRPSPLAGRWYPANSKELAESVDGYITQAQVPAISGKIVALISPHAGHLYSGPVAGYAFKAIQNRQADLVIILSPFHQIHSGSILTSGHDAYQTPLGEVPLALDSLEWVDTSLRDRAGTGLTQIRNDSEHAVEILLPFFQRTLSDGFEILPLMIRDQDPSLMRALGATLAELMVTRDALLAASTDLSHFHPAVKARELDQNIIRGIQSLDPKKLYQSQKEDTGSACGLGALAAMIWAVSSGSDTKAHILNYAHSGNITGDNNSVVGYTSVVITHG